MTEQPREHQTMFVTGSFDVNAPETELQFADGRIVRLPTALLQHEPSAPAQSATALLDANLDAVLIPIVEEQLQVSKRLVETGKLLLHKGVETFDVTLDEPLAMTSWYVERVAKHEVLALAPSTRHEGDTTIYPIVEERLILTKELLLVGEVHVTHVVSERRDTQTVSLRRGTLDVERKSPDQI